MLNIEKTYSLSIRPVRNSGGAPGWICIRRTTLNSLIGHAERNIGLNGGDNSGLTMSIQIHLDMNWKPLQAGMSGSRVCKTWCLNGRGLTILDDVRVTTFENEIYCACNVERFLRAKFAEMELDMFHQMHDEELEAQNGGAS